MRERGFSVSPVQGRTTVACERKKTQRPTLSFLPFLFPFFPIPFPPSLHFLPSPHPCHHHRPMSASWPPSDGDRSGASTPEDSMTPVVRTPHTSTFESPLLPQDSKPPSRSLSASASTHFISSPLNPHSPLGLRSRPASRGSTYFNRIASEESQALTAQMGPASPGQRGSMVLYRLAQNDTNEQLVPPKMLQQRDSLFSEGGDSVFSLSSDSKYPSGGSVTLQRGWVPYAYDPELDSKDEPEEDDDMRAPDKPYVGWSWRGFFNVGMICILVAAILSLFVFYPMYTFYRDNSRNLAIDGNIRINSTGQAPVL